MVPILVTGLTPRWSHAGAGDHGAHLGSVVVVMLYDRLGAGYAQTRRGDPRLASQIRAALGSARSVVNLGAGTGSYEPADLRVVAIEPSTLMIGQRPADAAPVVQGVAEDLPFPDGTFEAGMAVLSVHHWRDPALGLGELRRVARGAIVVLSWDQGVFDDFWMVADYVPASCSLDRTMPTPGQIADMLGGGTVQPVPVPADCLDGFYAAWWRRPWAYLDPTVRAGISGLARLAPEQVEPGLHRLGDDLRSGAWARRHADLLGLQAYDAGYRLIVTS